PCPAGGIYGDSNSVLTEAISLGAGAHPVQPRLNRRCGLFHRSSAALCDPSPRPCAPRRLPAQRLLEQQRRSAAVGRLPACYVVMAFQFNGLKDIGITPATTLPAPATPPRGGPANSPSTETGIPAMKRKLL